MQAKAPLPVFKIRIISKGFKFRSLLNKGGFYIFQCFIYAVSRFIGVIKYKIRKTLSLALTDNIMMP